MLNTPLVGCLATASGRHYLRIVAQLRGEFAQWRTDGPMVGPHLRAALTDLEQRSTGREPEARAERLIAMMMLQTSVFAERARHVDGDGELGLPAAAFEANLVDMMVGIIEAPVHDGAPV